MPGTVLGVHQTAHIPTFAEIVMGQIVHEQIIYKPILACDNQ